MPRLLLGVFILLLVSVSTIQAQGDAVLLTVGPEKVGVEEFLYHFSRSSERRAEVFVQTLGRFKQKVLWAKEMRLDTLETHRRQKDSFQKTMMSGRRQAGRTGDSLSSEKEWIKLMYVTYPLSQHSSKMEEQLAWAYMDSLYVALNGNNEVALASLPWTQTRFLLNEWQEQLDGLAQGAYSRPFCSPLGIHIIAWTGRRMEKSLEKKYGQEVMDFRLKEIEESLLVASLEHYMEESVACTESELEHYFELHKEAYGWGTPHYKGAVIHCRNKKEAKRIKQYLKKYPEELWQEAWKRMPADVSQGCLMEIGLFAIGTNPYIDKLVFKCGEYLPKEDFPYVWVMGKKMKKGPGSYKDVFPKVEKDYRKIKKTAEMEAILQKYRVEIAEEVLKTVNRWGNK